MSKQEARKNICPFWGSRYPGADPRVEEKANLLFQPDVLLKAEFYDTTGKRRHEQPEKRLMLAILEDALLCFQNYFLASDKKGRAAFRDAEEWILDKNSSWLFSCENLCEELGLNPDYVRAGLMRWKEKQLAQRQTARIYRLRPRVQRKVPDGLNKPLRAAGV